MDVGRWTDGSWTRDYHVGGWRIGYTGISWFPYLDLLVGRLEVVRRIASKPATARPSSRLPKRLGLLVGRLEVVRRITSKPAAARPSSRLPKRLGLLVGRLEVVRRIASKPATARLSSRLPKRLGLLVGRLEVVRRITSKACHCPLILPATQPRRLNVQCHSVECPKIQHLNIPTSNIRRLIFLPPKNGRGRQIVSPVFRSWPA